MAGGASVPSAVPEHLQGNLIRDDSDGLSHMISQVSNDSIRQLIKLASCGFEEDFVLDDIDLSDFCQAWDAPSIPEVPPSQVDLQMDMDIMQRFMHPGFDQNNDVPYSEADVSMQEAPYAPVYPPEEIPRREEHEERCMTGNMEAKAIPEMDVKKPRVNLVLGSNVVRLASHCCPKPSVRVLPSHVIQAHQMTDNIQRTAAPYHATSYGVDNSGCLPRTDGWHGEGYDWPVVDDAYGMEQMPVYEEHPEAMYQVGAQGHGTHEEYREMMMDTVQPPNPFLAHIGFDDSAQYYHMPMFERTDDGGHGSKVIRKNTKGDKASRFVPLDEPEGRTVESVAERLDACQIESRSTEIRKIQSMTEAEICNYVKTMAPQLQNNAWEEIIKESKFEERLAKAEQKMQEHTNELEHIRQQMALGELHPKIATEMIRKVYNRREAAASRSRREQGLVKAAIKKRTLEKICSWMREHLFGNSELFSTNSLDSEVRRSRSDGTKRTCDDSCEQ